MSVRDSNKQKLKEQNTITRIEQQAFYSGPLPPPAILQGYKNIDERFPERLLALVEKQTDHRIEIETKVIDANNKAEERGQWMAFVMGLTAILGAILLLFFGKSLEGFGLLVGAVGTLVGVFVYGKKQQQKELEQNKKALESTKDNEK